MDIFAQAVKQIFSSPIAVSAVYTDYDSNQINVRCVVQDYFFQDGSSFSAPIPEWRKVIRILKDNFSYTSGDTIEIDTKTYKVDGIIKDDLYEVQLSVVEQ